MQKKLYKSRYGNTLDGVCKGIAEYFSIDPTLVRVAWAIGSLVAPPAGIFGYLICSVVIPREPYQQ